jgi:hypothetical protein
MDTSDKQIKRIILNRMERCGVCHHLFEPEDIHVISRRPDMWMMVVECDECHSRNFVAAVLNDGDPSEAQLALRRLSEGSDREGLDADPVDSPAPAVTTADLLDMHEFLRGFDGDFRRLFAKP